MTTEIELLPLPAEDYVDGEGLWEKRYGPYSSEQMEDYARANVLHHTAPLQAEIEAQQQDKLDAARWRYIRRKLCLTGNGDGACAMQAINLPANIQGWPEPGQVAEFCDAAIDAAIEAAMSKENSND